MGLQITKFLKRGIKNVLQAPDVKFLVGAANAVAQATVLTASWLGDQVEAYNTNQEKFRGTLAAIYQDDLDLVALTDQFYNANKIKDLTKAILIGAAVVTASIVAGVCVLQISGIGSLLAGGLAIVGGFTGKYLGFAIVGLSLSAIFATVIQTTNFVLNFNVNVSDNELIEQTINGVKNLYGLLGNAIGSATGWLVCGALPGAVMFAFNPMMAAAVMQDLDEEGKEEITLAIAAVTRSAFQTLLNAQAANVFSSTRRWLKKRPDGVLGTLVRRAIGEENFKKWGESNRPSFTIKKDIIDKAVESIQDKDYRLLVENMVEEFGDSCMEAGMTLANSADAFLAAQKLMTQNANTGVGIS